MVDIRPRALDVGRASYAHWNRLTAPFNSPSSTLPSMLGFGCVGKGAFFILGVRFRNVCPLAVETSRRSASCAHRDDDLRDCVGYLVGVRSHVQVLLLTPVVCPEARSRY